MKIHTVRQPFLCRIGQFEEGKRSLCVGLDYNTLKKTNEFWCYLGVNKKVHYEINTTEALRIGQSWTNARGKTVIIIPLMHFKVVEVKRDKEESNSAEGHGTILIQSTPLGQNDLWESNK